MTICLNGGETDAEIAACRRVIQDGKASVGDRSLAHGVLGYADVNTGAFDPAIEEFGKAIALDPNAAFAYNGRATCTVLQG